MEVSKLTFTQQKQATFDNPIQLSMKRKRQIRIASIIGYLDKNDNIATTQQLYQIAGYTSRLDPIKAKQNGSAFIQNLIKTEVLRKEPHKGNTKQWTVLKVEASKPKVAVEQVKVKVFDLTTLAEKAREFYWETQSDSLHDFVTKLTELEGTENESV